jgi:hypothetical protein
MGDSHREAIEIHSANVTSIRNPVGVNDQRLDDATSLVGFDSDDDRIVSGNPQYTGDDGSYQGYHEYLSYWFV